MEREILFRGKRVDNGEWVEGNYLDVYTSKGFRSLIMGKRYDEEKCCITNHAVIEKSTRGMFTGLTDKNGEKIFEGDIVKIDYEVKDDLNYDYSDLGRVFWYQPHAKFMITSKLFPDDCCEININRRYEVIGNIHDNPELLGGE